MIKQSLYNRRWQAQPKRGDGGDEGIFWKVHLPNFETPLADKSSSPTGLPHLMIGSTQRRLSVFSRIWLAKRKDKGLWHWEFPHKMCWSGYTKWRPWSISPNRVSKGFPGGAVVKNPLASARDVSLIPGLGRSCGVGNGNPSQYFCLENSMFIKLQRVGHDWVAEHRQPISRASNPLFWYSNLKYRAESSRSRFSGQVSNFKDRQNLTVKIKKQFKVCKD